MALVKKILLLLLFQFFFFPGFRRPLWMTELLAFAYTAYAQGWLWDRANIWGCNNISKLNI